jgi:hypothetical protein
MLADFGISKIIMTQVTVKGTVVMKVHWGVQKNGDTCK